MEFIKLVGPAGVFFVMFALGTNLSIDSFSKVFKNLKNFLVGIFCQSIVLPFIGLFIISITSLKPEFQFGIFLLLIMPSAAMSNYATRLANGNVALSISLTSFCALFSFITIPLYLVLFEKLISSYNINLNLLTFSLKTFIFITLPVFIGIFCRQKFPKTFEKLSFTLDRMALILFLLIVLIAIYTEKDNLVGYFEDIGLVMFVILIIIFISALLITKIFVQDTESKRAIRIEALLQNGAMGFIIGSLIFSEIIYLVPIVIYALLQYTFLLFYLGNIQIKN